jgi:hypothetical protein
MIGLSFKRVALAIGKLERFTMPNAWNFDPASVVDPIGRIVRSESRIGRAINPSHTVETRELVSLAEKNKWFDAGLIQTSISSDSFDTFSLVLEHEPVPFVTQRGEWSAIGLQRAARCVLTLSLRLFEDGYCLHDPHPWNVLFDATTPYFIDFTSIRPIAQMDGQSWFQQFNQYFLAPLFLFAEGKGGLARSLTFEHMKGAGLWILRNSPALIVYLPHFKEYGRQALEHLSQLVDGLCFANLGGEWDGYDQPNGNHDLRLKDVQVAAVLNRLNFKTAIDIGTNRGLHSFMCEKRGAKVIACDIEEGCVNDLFLNAERQSKDVLPLVLDVVSFAGSSGAFNTQPAANERLRCELVLALALVHHVSFRRRFYPEALLDSLASFASEIALIEFVPDDDWHVVQWGLQPLRNYTLEGFRRILSNHFREIEDVPVEPAPRRLFICRGKKNYLDMLEAIPSA